MTRYRKAGAIRNLACAALSCVSLAVASEALAEEYDVLLSVDGWPKISARLDGKLQALGSKFSLQASQGGAVLSFRFEAAPLDPQAKVPPDGTRYASEAVALLTKHALQGSVVKSVLVESFESSVAKPPARAPFALRLSDVRVTSIQFSFSQWWFDADVTLQASRIEVFTANQTATGAIQPGQQFGWDFKAGKPL